MPAERLRVAVYGVGSMGRHHARHLGELGVDVVLVDPAHGHHGDEREIDAAVVAVPTQAHVTVARPLLDRGIPCLVEKPLAATAADAAVLAAYPHLAVGHVERFNPTLRALDGVAIRFVQTERHAAYSGRGTDVDVILDLMIHDLDIFLGLVGADVVEVRANGIAVATGGVDIAQARVTTRAGHVGTFTASRVSRKQVRSFRAFADDAYWSLDLGARVGARVTWGDGGLVETPVRVEPLDPLRAELEAFLAAVRGLGPYTPSGASALAAMRLAEQVQGLCVAS